MGQEMTTEGGLRLGAVDAIAERLSGHADLYLPHSAFGAREEPVSQQDKKQHLVELVQRDCAIFLERYGSSLFVSELREFDPLKDDYEVDWHLKRLKAKLDPSPSDRKNRAALVRNRRLAYMEDLVNAGTYFSEEEMRMRSPLLHHEYLGQFQDPTTRGIARPGEKFADLLGRQVDEAFVQQKLMEERRKAGILVESEPPPEEQEQEVEEEEEEEEGQDEPNTSVDKELSGEQVKRRATEPVAAASQLRLTTSKSVPDAKLQEFSREMESKFVASDAEQQEQQEHQPEVSEEDMRGKLLDFTKLMQEKFLYGEDSEHVDYEKIDSDATLDDHWLKQMSQDAEAKYFEDD